MILDELDFGGGNAPCDKFFPHVFIDGKSASAIAGGASEEQRAVVVAERQELRPAVAVHIALGILDALDESHRAGIIHRDIKSANIMITDTGVVKVMDFGIARAVSESANTQAYSVGIVGTAQYFSPEQARGEHVDARTDLYSTGVLLYEMLAGRPPFKGETAVSVAYQHVSEAVTPPSVHNPMVAPELDAVVIQAMAKDRNDRFQTADEFREHLAAAVIAMKSHQTFTGSLPLVNEPEAAAAQCRFPSAHS